MYGSSLRMETERPRLLSSRPMLAAVMPLPSDDVTPPVTKTYFATGQVLRGFFRCYLDPDRGAIRLGQAMASGAVAEANEGASRVLRGPAPRADRAAPARRARGPGPM